MFILSLVNNSPCLFCTYFKCTIILICNNLSHITFYTHLVLHLFCKGVGVPLLRSHVYHTASTSAIGNSQ